MSDVPADGKSAAEGPERSPAGVIEIRRALVGLGQVWLAAVAGFGSVLAASYGLAGSPGYLLASAGAAAIAVLAGLAALGTFGYR